MKYNFVFAFIAVAGAFAYYLFLRQPQKQVDSSASNLQTFTTKRELETTNTSRMIKLDADQDSIKQAKKIDYQKSLASLMENKDAATRLQTLHTGFTKWCKSDPEAAAKWAAENTDLRLSSDDQLEFIKEGLSIWAYQGQPREAADYASHLKLEDPSFNPIDLVTAVWVKTDYAGTKSYIEMPDKELQPTALRGLVSEVAKNDPVKAAQLSQLYGSESDKNTTAGMVAQEWAKSDFNAATAWSKTLPKRQGEFVNMAIALGEVDKNPQVAANWAAHLPPSDTRGDIISMVALGLTIKDAGAGADWIASLPEGNDRNTAATFYINKNQDSYPAYSANLALTLTDPVKRQEQISTVLTKWMDTNPAQAQKWLSANPNIRITSPTKAVAP